MLVLLQIQQNGKKDLESQGDMFREREDTGYFIKKVEVKKSSIHGWGVFATEDIRKYQVIEKSPFIAFDWKQFKNCILKEHILNSYVFAHECGTRLIAIFGNVPIYNHSDQDFNCVWRIDTKNNSFDISSCKEIKKGDELTIRYVPFPLEFTESGAFFRSNDSTGLSDHFKAFRL